MHLYIKQEDIKFHYTKKTSKWELLYFKTDFWGGRIEFEDAKPISLVFDYEQFEKITIKANDGRLIKNNDFYQWFSVNE